jgi:hypothetical protein
MEDYKPNSHKYNEVKAKEAAEEPRERKVNKVITGEAIVKKKSPLKKIIELFLTEDMDNVMNSLRDDVLIPTIQNGLYDMVVNGVGMLFGIDNKARKSGTTVVPRVTYSKYYDQSKSNSRTSSNNSGTDYTFDDILIPTKGDAENVLSQLVDLTDQYDMASIADFYDLVGIKSKYTDDAYGWTNLGSASVIRVKDGYMINLPKATQL